MAGKKVNPMEENIESLKERMNARYAKAGLLHFCKLSERTPGNVVPFTAAENDLICMPSWQQWDGLLHKIATGIVHELRTYVADPEGLIKNRNNVSLCFQDAVPVYLDLSTGKVAVRYDCLDERRQRSLLEKLKTEQWDRCKASEICIC